MIDAIKYRLRQVKFLLLYGCKYLKKYIKFKIVSVKDFPDTIQLPITYKCNFDCVMCGMHKMVSRTDFTSDELEVILQDKLFSKIKHVGINGGEPFLRKDLVNCVNVILDTCPKIENLNIISNGYFTNKILNDLTTIKKIAASKRVRVNLSISIDAIGKLQDFHRGAKNAFDNASLTISKILEKKYQYVDSISIICTLTRHNIFYVNEVDLWAKERKINVHYNIATVNERIENSDKENDFSLFVDEEARMLATEFFYSKYKETREERYYGLYLFLKHKQRFNTCPCQYNSWVTLTPNANISYCATYSKELGSSLEMSANEIFQKNRDYFNMLCNDKCKHCSHYMGTLNMDGIKILIEEEWKTLFCR